MYLLLFMYTDVSTYLPRCTCTGRGQLQASIFAFYLVWYGVPFVVCLNSKLSRLPVFLPAYRRTVILWFFLFFFCTGFLWFWNWSSFSCWLMKCFAHWAISLTLSLIYLFIYSFIYFNEPSILFFCFLHLKYSLIISLAWDSCYRWSLTVTQLHPTISHFLSSTLIRLIFILGTKCFHRRHI